MVWRDATSAKARGSPLCMRIDATGRTWWPYAATAACASYLAVDLKVSAITIRRDLAECAAIAGAASGDSEGNGGRAGR